MGFESPWVGVWFCIDGVDEVDIVDVVDGRKARLAALGVGWQLRSHCRHGTAMKGRWMALASFVLHRPSHRALQTAKHAQAQIHAHVHALT
jgi:hypothetical protein